MAEVTVWGSVPVAVVVDTETREVTSVHAMDEKFEQNGKVYNAGGRRIAGVAARKARGIVDDPGLAWPGWEWGW